MRDEFKFKFDATEGTEADKRKFEYTGCDIEFANEYTCGFIPVLYGNETLLAYDVEVADCMFSWISHDLAAKDVVAAGTVCILALVDGLELGSFKVSDDTMELMLNYVHLQQLESAVMY